MDCELRLIIYVGCEQSLPNITSLIYIIARRLPDCSKGENTIYAPRPELARLSLCWSLEKVVEKYRYDTAEANSQFLELSEAELERTDFITLQSIGIVPSNDQVNVVGRILRRKLFRQNQMLASCPQSSFNSINDY